MLNVSFADFKAFLKFLTLSFKAIVPLSLSDIKLTHQFFCSVSVSIFVLFPLLSMEVFSVDRQEHPEDRGEEPKTPDEVDQRHKVGGLQVCCSFRKVSAPCRQRKKRLAPWY